MIIGEENYSYFRYLGDSNYLTYKESILMDKWGNLLSPFQWEWFVVLTFKYCVNRDTAKRNLNQWFYLLNRRRQKQVGFFAVIAWHADEKRYHIHLLMLGVGNLDRKTWETKWYFGHAWIEPYEEQRKGTFYLARMIAKKRAGDYFFGGILKNADRAKEIMKRGEYLKKIYI